MIYSFNNFILKTNILFFPLQYYWFLNIFPLKYAYFKKVIDTQDEFHTLTHAGKQNKLIDIIDFAFHFIHVFKIILVWAKAILDWRALKETLYTVITIFNFGLRSW